MNRRGLHGRVGAGCPRQGTSGTGNIGAGADRPRDGAARARGGEQAHGALAARLAPAPDAGRRRRHGHPARLRRGAAPQPAAGVAGVTPVPARRLPLWVLLNKLLGLYDRDANLIHKSTLDELPRIAHSVILGSAAGFLLVPLIPGIEMSRDADASSSSLGADAGHARACAPACASSFSSRSEPERMLIVGSGSVASCWPRKLGQASRVQGRPGRPRRPGVVGRRRRRPTRRRSSVTSRTSSASARSSDVERVVIAFSRAVARGPARGSCGPPRSSTSRSPSCRACSRASGTPSRSTRSRG